MSQGAAYRRGLADAVVLIAVRRFWPNVRIEEIGKAAGLSGPELQEAVQRHRRPEPKKSRTTRPANKAARTDRIPKPIEPPGMKWCSRGQHLVPIDEMGRNASRADGLSDTCKEHWREYWRQRRAAEPVAAGEV